MSLFDLMLLWQKIIRDQRRFHQRDSVRCMNRSAVKRALPGQAGGHVTGRANKRTKLADDAPRTDDAPVVSRLFAHIRFVLLPSYPNLNSVSLKKMSDCIVQHGR